MNFIFISPHFPETYWEFCSALRRNQVNVLGIADAPFDSLHPKLRESLTEYFRVNSLDDYDEVHRAFAFLTYRHGRIDWVESNNEYWLAKDARLRTDFNISTGIHADKVDVIKEKSEMKKCYIAAGIPTARQIKGSAAADEIHDFAKLTGYPLIAKPDIGVGAGGTHKIHDSKELEQFIANTPDIHNYVIEEFIKGGIVSYDAVINSKGEPVFESMTVWPPSIMDIVNKGLDLSYYVDKEIPDALKAIGRKTVKAFGVKSRFVHLEFFRLDEDREGLGKAGDFVALEVNMRPAGGYTPDMMNYAHSTDVYQIWADMVAFDERRTLSVGKEYYCVYAGRRNGVDYVHTHAEILDRYKGSIVMSGMIPQVLSGAMGDYHYTARLNTKEDVNKFREFVQERKK